MSLNLNTVGPAPKYKAIARAETTPQAPAVKTADVPKADPGALDSFKAFLKTSGIEEGISKAINAKSSDEVVAAVAAGLAQLAVERQKNVKEFDQKLHSDLRGTITRSVTNETAQKALLFMADAMGDKVASNLISAGIGSLAGTMTELAKDEAFRKMFAEDKLAFGGELAKRAGKNFGIALAAAFAVAKIEQLLPPGLKWAAGLLASLPVVGELFKNAAGVK